ncbi:MAG: hypothetical protein ACM34N_05360 [Ignavibacteria bacterium]
MLRGSVYPFVISVVMLVLFVIMNILILETYLKVKYSDEFDEYAKITKKFIPFIY